VVIVNWNTRDLLLDCVGSLLGQTSNSSLEVIVVDNASVDGSIQALGQRYPDVKHIRNSENLGFSRANNQGLRLAKGRYLCLVNSDVKALPGVLDRLRQYCDATPDVGAVGPRTVGGDGYVRQNCREFPTLRNAACDALYLDRLLPSVHWLRGRTMRSYDYRSITDVEVLSGCFLMVRRSVVEQVGLLDERFFIYSEDVDWCKRIRDAGWRVVFFPDAEAVHYGGSSSSAAPEKFNVEQLKANVEYWIKHNGRVQSVAFLVLQALGAGIRLLGWRARSIISRDSTAWSEGATVSHWDRMRWCATFGLRMVLGSAHQRMSERAVSS
jgi:GT2 family glycosyltransferase